MRPTRFIPLLKNLLKTQTIDNIVKSTTITNRNVIFDFNDKRHFGSTGVNHASPTAEKLPMRMLLLGSPGAGKGTQSTRIQANFNISAITSGDLLRQNIANGTEIGKIAAKHMERGAYVPDDVMIKLIIDELQKYERQDWLLDGFPRTIKQAKSLDDNLDLSGQPLNLVINLHVPEDVILRRIMDRWVHIPSGRVYNLSYNPPKILGLDDVTGEKLTKRVDDNTETFKIRLQKHHALTEPLLEYYDKKNLLVTFAGRTSDEIYPQIESELISRFKVNPRTSEAASNRQESSVSSNRIQNDVVNKENFLNAVA